MASLGSIGADRPTAVVTGAARRVGRATALALAEAGLDVVITYRSSSDEAADAVGRIERHGVLAAAERLDLDDLDATEAFGERLAKEATRVDVLVHNASIYGATPLDALSAEDLLRHYRVNAAGPAMLTRALAGSLGASTLPGGGSVVAMCDIHAMGRPRKQHLAYSMSKAALAELVRSLARDLAPNVRVNGVAPGVVAFPEAGRESDPELQRQYLSRVPLARSGAPEDAAATVRWLALDATYMTGEIVRLDGGRWLA